MNKVINIFSLGLFILFAFLTIGSIYDLGFSVYEVNDIPYIKPLVYSISVVFLLLGLVRIKRRLEGRKDIKNYNGFIYMSPISENQINYATLFIAVEIAFGSFMLGVLVLIKPLDTVQLVTPLLIIVSVLIIETLVYLIILRKNKTAFKVGISKNFVSYFDREMHIYYFKGLTRIEIYQNMINFQYKKGLNMFLSLTVISDSEQVEFFKSLESALTDKNVYFDDSFHQYIDHLNS